MLQLPSNITRFRAQNRSRRKLPLPAKSNVRVAQVSASAMDFDSVQVFCRDRWDTLEAFRPGVLVGSAADLRSLAELGERRVLDLASVDHATFVLTRAAIGRSAICAGLCCGRHSACPFTSCSWRLPAC